MKRMIISLALAMSLALGVAGSVAAGMPDSHACQKTSGTPGLTAILAHTGGCEDHGGP